MDETNLSTMFRSAMRRNLRVGFFLGVMVSVIAVMLWSLI
jgi:hypothetical protein